MNINRRALSALGLVAALGLSPLSACSNASEPGSNPTGSGASSAPSSAPTSSSDPTAPASSAPTGSADPTDTAPPPSTSSAQPVPKVERSDAPREPTASAKPARVDQKVRYSDGVSLQIQSVKFAKEKKKGPGSFPGREYAVLSLQVDNGSDQDLSMSTVVITVLDKSNKPVAPVYTDEARVQDFSGTLKTGKAVKAKYAFAVPKSSRSKVTIVVDFDGVHTSAVFRGELS